MLIYKQSTHSRTLSKVSVTAWFFEKNENEKIMYFVSTMWMSCAHNQIVSKLAPSMCWTIDWSWTVPFPFRTWFDANKYTSARGVCNTIFFLADLADFNYQSDGVTYQIQARLNVALRKSVSSSVQLNYQQKSIVVCFFFDGCVIFSVLICNFFLVFLFVINNCCVFIFVFRLFFENNNVD